MIPTLRRSLCTLCLLAFAPVLLIAQQGEGRTLSAHLQQANALLREDKPAEAQRQIAVARQTLDGDAKMAESQERFFSHLVGYVALYTGDLPKAEAELTRAIATKGNQNDPFLPCLLAMTYEKMGQAERATEYYRKAYGLATSHNPPAAFVRPFARKKLGL